MHVVGGGRADLWGERSERDGGGGCGDDGGGVEGAPCLSRVTTAGKVEGALGGCGEGGGAAVPGERRWCGRSGRGRVGRGVGEEAVPAECDEVLCGGGCAACAVSHLGICKSVLWGLASMGRQKMMANEA